jgi:hypothetical protein
MNTIRFRNKWVGSALVAAGALASWRWPALGWHARGIVLALLGAAFFLAFVTQGLSARALLRSGVRTEGTVVRLEEDTDSDDGRDWSGSTIHSPVVEFTAADESRPTTHSPVVEFTTADGRKVVFTGSLGSSSAPEVGTAVPVRYRPHDPSKAEIDKSETWLQPTIFGGLVGVGLFVAAVIVYRHG